jgi:ribosome recycling factor
MIQQIIQQHKENFDKIIDHLHHDLAGFRTGRASTALLSGVMVDAYGVSTPLQQIANVTVADSRTLVIQPWDKGQLGAVEKGILAANLGVTPASDGQVVRLNLPPLNEERRKELVKVVGQVAEKARVSIRNVREDVLKAIKKAEADGGIGKDEVATGQKKLQELIDELNAKIKVIVEDKEKEIMTV